jgi:hypothetical protein
MFHEMIVASLERITLYKSEIDKALHLKLYKNYTKTLTQK